MQDLWKTVLLFVFNLSQKTLIYRGSLLSITLYITGGFILSLYHSGPLLSIASILPSSYPSIHFGAKTILSTGGYSSINLFFYPTVPMVFGPIRGLVYLCYTNVNSVIIVLSILELWGEEELKVRGGRNKRGPIVEKAACFGLKWVNLGLSGTLSYLIAKQVRFLKRFLISCSVAPMVYLLLSFPLLLKQVQFLKRRLVFFFEFVGWFYVFCGIIYPIRTGRVIYDIS